MSRLVSGFAACLAVAGAAVFAAVVSTSGAALAANGVRIAQADAPAAAAPAAPAADAAPAAPAAPVDANAPAAPAPAAPDAAAAPAAPAAPADAAAAPAAGQVAAVDGKEATERVCTACHDIGTVTSHRHDQAGWTTTVDNMVAGGASPTPAEYTAIVAYLTATYGL